MDEKTEKTKSIEVSNSRRGFMRKAVYVAPALIVLGSLTKSKDVKAFGPPP